jgi:hypothetical protein
MSSTSYKIGKWAAENKVLTLLIVYLCVWALTPLWSEREPRSNPTSNPPVANAKPPQDPCTGQELEDRTKMAREYAKKNNHENVVNLLRLCEKRLAEGTEAQKLLSNAYVIVEKNQAAYRKRELAQWKKEGVSIGMTPERVLQSSWGKPEKINTTTNAFGTSEQWVYRGHNYLYFQDGKLTTIQN